MNSEGLLAVTDEENRCVHLLSKDGALVRSIGKGELGSELYGVAFDLEGNVWVADRSNNEVVKLSINGKHLQTLRYVSSRSDGFNHPTGVSVSTEGMIYICDCPIQKKQGCNKHVLHQQGCTKDVTTL